MAQTIYVRGGIDNPLAGLELFASPAEACGGEVVRLGAGRLAGPGGTVVHEIRLAPADPGEMIQVYREVNAAEDAGIDCEHIRRALGRIYGC